MSRQVSTVQEAVVVLGMRVVRNLAIVASTYPWLQKSLTGYGLDSQALWAHSYAVGVASQTIADKTRQADSSEAFVAGLLHNMGKLALNTWLENKIVPMISLCEREGLSFDAIERKVLGFDHADVGAHLARSWNLPVQLTRAIELHHRPLDASASEKLPAIVHLADHFVTSFGIGSGGDSFRYEVYGEVLDVLQIPVDSADELANDFLMAFERHEKLFEVKAA
jgi:putative nucleotidyltransferase with HDIG domain